MKTPATVSFALLTDPHLAIGEKTDTWKQLTRTEELLRDHLRMIDQTPDVQFVLLPGDLTKDSEPWNHLAIRQVLTEQRLPVYVIPGNHDARKENLPIEANWGIAQFASFYQGFGPDGTRAYYSLDLTPDLHLIALNSADTADEQMTHTWAGRVDEAQLLWLDRELIANAGKRCMVMLHHNLLPHTRDDHPGTDFANFLLENRDEVLTTLHRHGVQVVLTGHHHVNHIARDGELYEITTAGTGSYPSLHRIFELSPDSLRVRTVNHPDRGVADVGLAELEVSREFAMPSGSWEELATIMYGRGEDRETILPLRTVGVPVNALGRV